MMKSMMIALLLAVCAVGAVVMNRFALSSSAQEDHATPIQVGVMSEKQKEHSKLYEHYHTGRKLDALPPHEFRPGVEPGVYIEPGTPVVNPDAPKVSFEQFIRDLACNADAVVLATVKDKASQLTESKEFIFTDYTATVEELYRKKPNAPIGVTSLITVTRPGGRVEINGKVIGALDSSFKLLKVEKRYLLFLKYLPQTNSYQSMRQGAFLVNDRELVAMSDEALPGGPGDTRPFTSALIDALNSACNR